MNINKKMAEVRTEADNLYKAAKDLKKDAAEKYQTVDRLWAAKMLSEMIRKEFLKKGPATLEPDLIDETLEIALADFINQL